MTNNYVIFDANGLLGDSELHPISKGNNNVDRFNVAFANYDYTNTYITVAVTLPDGNTLPELATSIKEFTFKNITYKGYNFTVSEPLTAQAGTLTFTIVLKSKEDDSRLCTSRLNITIYDTDVPVEPTITEAQLNSLLIAIDDTGKELDEKKLNKDFSLYEKASNVNGKETIAVYKDGTNKTIAVEDTYNITNINGVEPVNKKVELTAENIKYSNGTTASALTETINELANKINYSEGVMHRNGVIIQEEVQTSEYKGLVPYTYIQNDATLEQNVAVITEKGYKFKLGDLINLDVVLESIGVKGTITLNKVITARTGIAERYRVPIYTNGGDDFQETNMFVGYCVYDIAISENAITITCTGLKSLNSSTGTPTVTLKNIAILRA